jgi:hypothetical protein
MFLKHNERIYNLSAYHRIEPHPNEPLIVLNVHDGLDLSLKFSTFQERDKAYETIMRMMGDKLFILK